MPVPQNLSLPTPDAATTKERDASIFWKLKGRTAQATYKMFVKYSDPETVENDPHAQAFAQVFRDKIATPLLKSHLLILFSTKTQFVGSMCLYYVI